MTITKSLLIEQTGFLIREHGPFTAPYLGGFSVLFSLSWEEGDTPSVKLYNKPIVKTSYASSQPQLDRDLQSNLNMLDNNYELIERAKLTHDYRYDLETIRIIKEKSKKFWEESEKYKNKYEQFNDFFDEEIYSMAFQAVTAQEE